MLRLVFNFCNLLFVSSAMKLLLFGDSIDRFVGQDWCSLKYHTKDKGLLSMSHDQWGEWGSASLAYTGQKDYDRCSPCFCKYFNDSITGIHVFGSNPDEPYFEPPHETGSMPGRIRSTTYRIMDGAKEYLALNGSPNRIIFHSVLWDVMGETSGIHFQIEDFEGNLVRIFSEIKSNFGDNVDIGFRTAPLGERVNNRLAPIMNDFTRSLATTLGCTLYDFEKDLWSVIDQRSGLMPYPILFRDEIHPKAVYTRSAAEKLLGVRFSRFMFPRGVIYPEVIGDLEPFKHMEITFMRERNPTSLDGDHTHRPQGKKDDAIIFEGIIFTIYNGRRHHTEDWDQFILCGYEPHDIREVTREELASIPLGHPGLRCTPPEVEDDLLSYVVMQDGVRRRWTHVPTRSLMHMHFGLGDVMTVTSSVLRSIPVLGAMPPLFDGERKVVTTVSGRLFVILETDVAIALSSLDDLAGINQTYWEKPLEGVDDMWLELVEPLQGIPHFFKDNTLIRLHTSKQVFWIKDWSKFPVHGREVFSSRGWEFENVVILVESEEVIAFNALRHGHQITQ